MLTSLESPMASFGQSGQKERLSTEILGLKIEGSQKFIDNTKKAVLLLSKLREYEFITQNIGLIKESPRSEMDVYAEMPTFKVGERTYSQDNKMYASAIAHDAYHNYLYRLGKYQAEGREPNNDFWTGTEAEKKCMGFQLQVLKQISRDPVKLIWLKIQSMNPRHHLIKYEGRNW